MILFAPSTKFSGKITRSSWSRIGQQQNWKTKIPSLAYDDLISQKLLKLTACLLAVRCQVVYCIAFGHVSMCARCASSFILFDVLFRPISNIIEIGTLFTSVFIIKISLASMLDVLFEIFVPLTEPAEWHFMPCVLFIFEWERERGRKIKSKVVI